MATETERKFLVKSDAFKRGATPVLYVQGFLSSDPERVVRVRTASSKGYLTVKGLTRGCSRTEFEYEIPVSDALEMIGTLCQQPEVRKFRYNVVYKGKLWQVDEFLGENEGLVVAEVELLDEKEVVALPDWVGEEVTGDTRYYNANLVKNPFSRWVKEAGKG